MNKTAIEEWRPVVGYESVYEVSNIGRVKRVKKACGTQAGRILKQGDRRGYSCVVLYSMCNRRIHSTHDIVCKSFMGIRKNGYFVNHKDFNRKNNNIDNLEYVTAKENINYSWINGRYENSRRSRMTPVVRLIDGVVFQSVKDAAMSADRTDNAVTEVLKGRNKTCNGSGYCYYKGEKS